MDKRRFGLIKVIFMAVILAAGLSRRMGGFKPLLKIDGVTITDRLTASFRENGVDVYVVAGYRRNDLAAGIISKGITIVDNPDYERGMFTSVQAGVRALGSSYAGTFMAPLDIPLVSPATIRTLLEAAGEHPGKVIHPTFRGRRGHPPLVPAALFPAITGEPPDSSLKEVLGRYRDQAVDVDVPDRNIHIDIDRPADYENVLAWHTEKRGTGR